ncbi:hypothetical protein LMH87_002164 [Akanthomyces muscarius]|uniref:WD40 repeat-like protein n=1 Tax=Akanthomyces muscarius TaxID=2231603 RepID=A0A9W8UIA9_AKAMU|nr:hypothetical protein LMH87_002164 [Akanthomyces muscarius]KAJ4147655.1 hypothetical protein LMH87_002164 [Akanthomyces muscarius]
MVNYSSLQFRQDWRHAVDQEFINSDGQPFPYAPGGHQGWGNEIAKIPLQNASRGCISSDGSRMAIAVDKDVHVFDTKTHDTIAVLKAHLKSVTSIAFQPNNAGILLTSSMASCTWTSGKVVVEADAAIIAWRLDERTIAETQEADLPSSVVKASAAAAAADLAKSGTELRPEELEELERLMAPSIQHVVTKHAAAGKTRIHGRLQTSFGSNVFSPSGRSMVYLPGNSPETNDVAKWDMCICCTDDLLTPTLTLSGHTDGIMWVGWNHDETLFASVAWDSTVRVWDAVTGETVHVFRTGDRCQNWTGAFSPDSKYLATTDGTTRVHIYDLAARRSVKAGAEATDAAHWVYKGPKERRGWQRTVAWHPNGTWLAVGKSHGDELLLLDVQEKRVLQKRTLSTAAAHVDREELRATLGHFVSVSQVRFADAGRKLVVWNQGDDSIEVFDLEKEQKWRFGRGGTEDVPGAEAWRDENGKVTSPSGSGMLAWEKESNLYMASIDGDAVRFWSISLD